MIEGDIFHGHFINWRSSVTLNWVDRMTSTWPQTSFEVTEVKSVNFPHFSNLNYPTRFHSLPIAQQFGWPQRSFEVIWGHWGQKCQFSPFFKPEPSNKVSQPSNSLTIWLTSTLTSEVFEVTKVHFSNLRYLTIFPLAYHFGLHQPLRSLRYVNEDKIVRCLWHFDVTEVTDAKIIDFLSWTKSLNAI